MLKELRARRFDTAYRALMSSLVGKPGYPEYILEHPALTQLFRELVQEGKFDAAEQTLSKIRDLVNKPRSMRGPDNVVLEQLADKSQAPASRQFFALANEGPKLHLFGGGEQYITKTCELALEMTFDPCYQSATIVCCLISGEQM